MEWYLPITILPGIGMLILSTVTQMMAISSEINQLLSKKCDAFQHEISHRKINQLNLLTKASALLYVSAAVYVMSGVVGAFFPNGQGMTLASFALSIGTLLVFFALALLIIYAFRAVKIRQFQHDHNHQQAEF